MNKSPKPILLVIGILFLIGAPLCYIGAGAYAYAQPRLYSATTGFELLFPSEDTPRLQGAFHEARQQYPKLMQEALTASVNLQQSGSAGQHTITAVDADPLTAANAANTLTILVADTLRNTSKEGEKRVDVLQRAEPPKEPSLPNVQQIMRLGTFAAVILCAIGILFISMASVRRGSAAARAQEPIA